MLFLATRFLTILGESERERERERRGEREGGGALSVSSTLFCLASLDKFWKDAQHTQFLWVLW